MAKPRSYGETEQEHVKEVLLRLHDDLPTILTDDLRDEGYNEQEIDDILSEVMVVLLKTSKEFGAGEKDPAGDRYYKS